MPAMTRRSLALALVFFTSAAFPASAGFFNFSGWDGLLKDHVSRGEKDGAPLSLVDYKALAADPRFRKTIAALEEWTPRFENQNEQKAFWINVYNIFAAKMITDHPGVESIRDIGSLFSPVWGKPAGYVGGRVYTLDEIEHDILRKLGDPRIHMAIVCASVSCPDLRRKAYDPSRLDEQLDDQVKAFLANEAKGLRIDITSGTLRLSSIFKWFAGDFESRGGVRGFIAGYLSPARAAFVRDENNPVVYMGYNWKVNGR
ncbi:MAG: DUF547 domain-containing protein [Candidatus Nitrospinota bacterium M3_3B_026]